MSDGIATAQYASHVREIEISMQSAWRDEHVDATEMSLSDTRKSRYVLGMFPYPSGNAHLGHILVYTISDCLARLGRFKGENVMNPLGWDAFGLPAENAAIKNNMHPMIWTSANIKRMRDEQISLAGFSFDLALETDTSSPEFYKWTQWLFLKLYEHGQVYRSHSWVNWDPVDQTVLANEQVIDGCGWRSGVPIERRLMEQWCFRITDFAEALWNGLDNLPGWSERALSAQRNWIGRSEGCDVDFAVPDLSAKITVYTTRIDTIFGVTSLALAPEHPLVQQMTTDDARPEVDAYIAAALLKSELDRQSATTKSGVATGRFAINPMTGEAVPIYVSDYVLGGYGSGAIMSVPAHDARDFEFAQISGQPIRTVVVPADHDSSPPEGEAFEADGVLVNSGEFDGMTSADARKRMAEAIEARGCGKRVVRYRLRDWVISRQRFWGAPIPMLAYDDGSWEAVREADLPVKLPESVDFANASGGSPLATCREFVETVSPVTGRPARREIDTMDTFMCSAWYAWRFLDPQNSDQAWNPELARRWMPIDYYVGGLEHANQHLIYFRYISHFLHSIGLTPTAEPVRNFLDNGIIRMDGYKMSKSRGNVVKPEDVILRYGADALRLYILADTPYERDRDWDESGLEGKQRFLGRVFKTIQSIPMRRITVALGAQPTNKASRVASNFFANAIKDIAVQIDERRSFHTAIALLHTGYNKLAEVARPDSEVDDDTRSYCAQLFLMMLSLFCPHIADWLWRHKFADAGSLFKQRWPEAIVDTDVSTIEEIMLAVTIDGRRRGEISVDPKLDDDALKSAAMNANVPAIRSLLDGRAIKRSVVVRDNAKLPKLVNLVLE